MKLGTTIDTLHKLREKKRALEAQAKEVKDQMDVLEASLMEEMDKEGVAKATGRQASVSVSEAVYPAVEDWDRFYAYLHRMKYYHLLERRPAVLGCRELFEKRGKIPGVVPFVKRQLSIRSL